MVTAFHRIIPREVGRYLADWSVTHRSLASIITARIQRMREGTVFMFSACQSKPRPEGGGGCTTSSWQGDPILPNGVRRRGGYPFLPNVEGDLHPSQLGVPHLAKGGTPRGSPHLWLDGVPPLGLDGVSPTGTRWGCPMSRLLHQDWMGVPIIKDRGTPLLGLDGDTPSGLVGGTPSPIRTGWGYPFPHQKQQHRHLLVLATWQAVCL